MAGKGPAFSVERLGELNEREWNSYLGRVLMKSDPNNPHTLPIVKAFIAGHNRNNRSGFVERLTAVAGNMTPAKWAKIASLMKPHFEPKDVIANINGESSGAVALRAMRDAGYSPRDRAQALKEMKWVDNQLGAMLKEGDHTPTEAVHVMSALDMTEHEITRQLQNAEIPEKEIQSALEVYRNPPVSSFLGKLKRNRNQGGEKT